MSVLWQAAFWAFLGGVVYSGGRLATALWGGTEITPQATRLAWAQFFLSLVLAPTGGAAITEVVLDSYPEARVAATALVIGLMINGVAAAATEPAFIRKALSSLLRGAADRLSGGPQ